MSRLFAAPRTEFQTCEISHSMSEPLLPVELSNVHFFERAQAQTQPPQGPNLKRLKNSRKSGTSPEKHKPHQDVPPLIRETTTQPTMKNPILSLVRTGILSAGVLALFCAAGPSPKPVIKNVVLVHGAWVDGSGWQPVSDLLTRRGYRVSVVQIPETSFPADVATVKRVLARQPGPCILVGHSYGGSVICEAGVDPHVAGLVYVAAHAPDVGEDEATLGAKTPSVLAKTPGAIQVTSDGFTMVKPELFPKLFAPDLSKDVADFMALSQVPAQKNVFRTPLTAAAWKTKPSWGIVAGADQIISPDLEKWYYERAGSHWIEIKGVGHDIYRARPKVVASVIEQAAQNSLK